MSRFPSNGKQSSRISHVRVEQVVDCPFGLAVESAARIFPLLAMGNGGVRLPLHALHKTVTASLAQRVKTHHFRQVDSTELGRPHDEVCFDWIVKSALLPDFQGVIRFRIVYEKTRISIEGRYTPPFGAIGQIFDRIIGHSIAHATTTDLLHRLSCLLEERWLEVRQQLQESAAG